MNERKIIWPTLGSKSGPLALQAVALSIEPSVDELTVGELTFDEMTLYFSEDGRCHSKRFIHSSERGFQNR